MCGRFGLDIPPKALQEHFQLAKAPDFPASCNIAPGSQVLGIYLPEQQPGQGPDHGPGQDHGQIIRRDQRPDGRPLRGSEDTGLDVGLDVGPGSGSGRVAGLGDSADGPLQPRAAGFFRWGLVPHWSKEAPQDARMINARSETAFEKPSFRDPMRRRRLIVPATVFYEWQVLGKDKPKQPWAFRLASGEPMALAGIWDSWRDPSGQGGMVSLAILTCAPNDLAAQVHDRMPVILEPGHYAAWLDPATPPREVAGLLAPLAAWKMEAFKVGRAVNNPLNAGPECLAPPRSEPSLLD